MVIPRCGLGILLSHREIHTDYQKRELRGYEREFPQESRLKCKLSKMGRIIRPNEPAARGATVLHAAHAHKHIYVVKYTKIPTVLISNGVFLIFVSTSESHVLYRGALFLEFAPDIWIIFHFFLYIYVIWVTYNICALSQMNLIIFSQTIIWQSCVLHQGNWKF